MLDGTINWFKFSTPVYILKKADVGTIKHKNRIN